MTIVRLLVCAGLLAGAACAPPRAPEPEAPALHVVVPRESPPYAFRRGGQLVGLEVDFASQLAAALGRTLDLTESEWGDVLPAVRDRRADLAMGGISVTRARRLQVAFTDPYVRSGLLAVMRREDVGRFPTPASVLATSEPIGVVGGTTGEAFVRQHATTQSLSVYPITRSAITELLQRRVTLVVHDAPVAIWFAAADEANLAVLLRLLTEEDLAWATSPEDEPLRTAVNGVLAGWRTDGTRERILARWLPYWQRLESAAAGR